MVCMAKAELTLPSMMPEVWFDITNTEIQQQQQQQYCLLTLKSYKSDTSMNLFLSEVAIEASS